jgi:hypothetical protein
MTVMDNEDPTDPSPHEPRVTGSPEAIWLVYGDLEEDATHAECADSGEVTWCEDAQFPADVRYTRTDLVAERVRAAVAAERDRWTAAVMAELDGNGQARAIVAYATRDYRGSYGRRKRRRAVATETT